MDSKASSRASPVRAADPKLHELVVFERAGRFRDDCVAGAGITDEDDRLQGMPEAAQMLALLFRECRHPRIVTARGPLLAQAVDRISGLQDGPRTAC